MAKDALRKLIRYVPSGIYFSRIRVRGKLIRRSLKTIKLTVAKLRMVDLEKPERQRVEVQGSVTNAGIKIESPQIETIGFAGFSSMAIKYLKFGQLADNAAFIVAPRKRTKAINLGGRVFLHNYQSQFEVDKAALELILIAPMVVAS